MTINSYEKLSDKIGPTSAKSSCSKFSNQNLCRMKFDYTADDSISSQYNKCDKLKKKKTVSPYLTEGKIEMLSKVTERRLVRKKKTDLISSYPLAVNIYKANSDELALKRRKKAKKSVLTLPNNPVPLPQACTVSDMNDSEYFDRIKDERKLKPKNKRTTQTNRKPRINKAKQIFDRDAEYCSRFNIDLDSSSTDMINLFTGDGKKSIKRGNNKSKNSDINTHDVWAMLRNMNRFPFRQSPPLSDDSITPIKKRNKYNKHRNSQMDTKFIETHTTEEFTYFSNSLDKSAHNSQSSFDCITVIDKQDAYREFCEELKFVENKIPSYIKSQKNNKKLKSNTKARVNHTKIISDGGDNVKLLHHNDTNLRQRNRFPKSLQNNVKNQENKLILIHDDSNDPNSGCNNNYQNKISKEATIKNNGSHIHLCENTDGSSNGDIIKSLTGATRTFDDENKLSKLSPCDSQSRINSIIKVVLSKGPNVELAKNSNTPKRKQRSATTMPSSRLYPKLTVADIKRRLANIKFPLVILAKDELSSTPFQVLNYDPPQLAGLDEHIWPFMQNWQKKAIANPNKEDFRVFAEKSTQGMNGDYVGENNTIMKMKIGKNGLAIKNRNTIQPVALTKAENINNKPPKIRPVRQFKERMLQFLHKKSSFDGDCKKCLPEKHSNGREEVSNKVVDFSVNTQSNLVISNEQDKIISYKEDKMLNYISSHKEKPWAKGRWASDFIDNVIRKIKSGIYYNHDEIDFPRNHNCITKEGSVQTEIYCTNNDFCKNCMQKSNVVNEQNDKTYEHLKTIPGFDNNFLDLQIETINKNQIAIKHCVTNIVVQFDVGIPSKIDRVLYGKQSVSCVPVSVTESHTKIFKSKTMIVNAMLPAELCTILPNIMRNIINSKAVVIPKIVQKVETHLSTTTELARFQSGNSKTHLIPAINDVSPEFKILAQGIFPNNVCTIMTKKTSIGTKISLDPFEGFYSPKKGNLLPVIQAYLLLNYQIDSNTLYIVASHQSPKVVPEFNYKILHNKTTTCMELQPYVLSNKQVVPAYSFNIIDMASVILTNRGFNIQLNMPLTNLFNSICYQNDVNIISMGVKTVEDKLNCIISDVDSPYNKFQEHLQDDTRTKFKNTIQSKINKFENCKSCAEYCVTNYKHKKRTFVKLYKKCKSMSNITNERSSTALIKITNLEEFFLALGSAKALASVIDGTTQRNILKSIKEMKNWINEITPRQALLILLLANKKDTSNVLRYRPVILQGIAVKRITRASELDMEIEVIDRENLNTFPQYEGISYLPASVENQGSLLEELHWIAKTTASDYQRPFDESSERLLKSLLEKRKKLNPSYLRVMARYVGLGLLKSPK